MTGFADGSTVQHDVVAIFHASFHPTRGNVVDWSLKVDESIDLEGVEFSVLPSGLHLVERDTVYFSHSAHTGIALFRRRPTRSHGHRGFRLSSLGVLLAPSQRPRPWLHLASLQALADSLYASAETREERQETEPRLVDTSETGASSAETSSQGAEAGKSAVSPGDLREEDFAPAREWFERRKARDAVYETTWSGWSDELDGTFASPNLPTPHLPHLLRILGLPALTLYKFVLSRRRVMIFTLPPVEVACNLAWIAADLCREYHMSNRCSIFGVPADGLLESRKLDKEDFPQRESPRVLGMVTLSDIQRLEDESRSGRGWIACTTDAIFLEKAWHYDLIIDLTTSTPSKASRPTLYMSKPVAPTNGKRNAGKLETVRFTWSDVKLWTELDRILKLDSANSSHNHLHQQHNHARHASLPGSFSNSARATSPSTSSKWTDAFLLYEDVCLLCATLWMGLGTWRSNSHASFSTAPGSLASWATSSAPGSSSGKGKAGQWGAVRLEGDDDWSLEGTHMRNLGQGIEGRKDWDGARMRNLGLGIEGRPSASGSGVVTTAPKKTRKLSLSLSPLPRDRDKDKDNDGKSPTTSAAVTTGVVEQEGEDDAGEGAALLDKNTQEELRRQNTQTTLALLQTFHANTVFLLSKLHEVLPPLSSVSTPARMRFRDFPDPGSPTTSKANVNSAGADVGAGEADDVDDAEVVTITSRDLMAMELGVLSELDARFVEWLAEAEGYAGAGAGAGRRVVVKRGWQELFGILFGLR